MLDIARDPRWGRMVEGAGEDPYLGSAMAAAQVRGFQGDYIGSPDHILACMKHFAGYGAAVGGRDYDEAYIPETLLHNVYLKPFHAAVKAGIGSAMSAYLDLNDVPATGNRWLLHDVLRDDWKFTGFVVSDANSVKSLQNHGYAKDVYESALYAFNAGVNMEMAIEFTAYSKSLATAVERKQITAQQIEEAARPILEMKIRLGLFDHPYVDEARSSKFSPHPNIAPFLARLPNAPRCCSATKAIFFHLRKMATKKSPSSARSPIRKSTRSAHGLFKTISRKLSLFSPALQNAVGSQAELNYAPGVQIQRIFPSFFDEIIHIPPEVRGRNKPKTKCPRLSHSRVPPISRFSCSAKRKT